MIELNVDHLVQYGAESSMFDILRRYAENTEILITVFHVLQYLVRDKPDRVRLTDSSLSNHRLSAFTFCHTESPSYVGNYSFPLCSVDS